MTVVYLMRHSSGDKNIDFTRIKDNFENQNRKYELSIEGEKTAYLYSKLKLTYFRKCTSYKMFIFIRRNCFIVRFHYILNFL